MRKIKKFLSFIWQFHVSSDSRRLSILNLKAIVETIESNSKVSEDLFKKILKFMKHEKSFKGSFSILKKFWGKSRFKNKYL